MQTPAVEHVSQPPAHGALQQRPLAQKPEAHWRVRSHTAPRPCAPSQAPVPVLHQAPTAQALSLLHDEGQIGLAPSQT